MLRCRHVPLSRAIVFDHAGSIVSVAQKGVPNPTDGKVHVTDASNASRTLLYNIVTGEWKRRAAEDLRRAALDAAGGALLETASLRRRYPRVAA